MNLTEQEWLISEDARPMWAHVDRQISNRKRRLLAIAFCRALWDHFNLRQRRLLLQAEAFAEDDIKLSDFLDIHNEAKCMYRWVAHSSEEETDEFLLAKHVHYACHVVHEYTTNTVLEPIPKRLLAGSVRPNLIRDLVGNPFRKNIVQPHWKTTSVLHLANAIFNDRSFDIMPILADALEEAGCDNTEILNHCREFPNHERGCWLVDAVLNKS